MVKWTGRILARVKHNAKIVRKVVGGLKLNKHFVACCLSVSWSIPFAFKSNSFLSSEMYFLKKNCDGRLALHCNHCWNPFFDYVISIQGRVFYNNFLHTGSSLSVPGKYFNDCWLVLLIASNRWTRRIVEVEMKIHRDRNSGTGTSTFLGCNSFLTFIVPSIWSSREGRELHWY